MTPLVANLVILAIGILIALGLVAFGALQLVKLGRALKERTDGYRTLPINRYIDIAEKKIGIATHRVAGLSGLLYRARAAFADLANARAKVAAIATSPSAIWRLGEILVTGK